jgi:hypothetical protein
MGEPTVGGSNNYYPTSNRYLYRHGISIEKLADGIGRKENYKKASIIL